MTASATPPISLLSLSIRNFRGLEDLSLDFRGPDGLANRIIVLAGPNGCGKTAVLEAALIVSGGVKLAVGPHDRKAIRRGSEDYLIQGDFVFDGTREETFITRFASSDSEPSESTPKIPYWYFSSWRTPSIVKGVDVTVGKAGRRPARTDGNRLRNVKQQLANRAAIERFPSVQRPWFGPYSDVIRSINEGWRDFYPDDTREFFVGLAESESRGYFDVFLGRMEGERLEVDLLSAGQLELFLFLSALALNEGREGLVIIDEPELHLDPQWHRPILRSLMRMQPRAQFIVATHSPEIYDAAKSYERHFLVPNDDPRARFWAPVRVTGE